jgi:hypothetical protein
LYHLGTFLVKRKVLFKNKGDDMTSFSEKLKELRKKNNLTQQELADKVGTNRVNVTKWETGRTEPTLENIVKLSKILDTTTDELLGRNINFRDTILNKKYKYDLSVLKESDTQNLYDLKITLAFDLLDESLNPAKLKEILMEKNKLNKDEELILDTILDEAKEFADDVNEFYKFKKSNKKFKWPWKKRQDGNKTETNDTK